MIEYTRSADAVTSTDEGTTLVVDGATGACVELSGTGAFLWDRLASPHTIEDLVAAAMASFTGDPAAISRQVERFIGELVRRDLLVVDQPRRS